MPGQPVQRASSGKGRDHARNRCQEAERELGQLPLLWISISMVRLTRVLRKSWRFLSYFHLLLGFLRSSSAFIPSTLYRWVPDSQIQTGVDDTGKKFIERFGFFFLSMPRATACAARDRTHHVFACTVLLDLRTPCEIVWPSPLTDEEVTLRETEVAQGIHIISSRARIWKLKSSVWEIKWNVHS